ncbi:uncharacterized protein LOC141532121 [Cotesia typhae]|uniref:uncharacterized protein LOC141532121 n=1 Tax=Cotesia typhae TaxID=2053667 RepID=UPI003D69A163
MFKVYKNRRYVKFNPKLIYDRIKLKCSTREKNDADLKDTCQARLYVSTSLHKRTLQVDECDLNHNHPPCIVGRCGPVKGRQLLLEKAIELNNLMVNRKKRSCNNVLPVKKQSTESGQEARSKLEIKPAVVILRRIVDPNDADFIKFLVFLDGLRSKLDIDAILNNKQVILLHHLSNINRVNILEIVNFDLMKRRKYFSRSALDLLIVMLNAKSNSSKRL